MTLLNRTLAMGSPSTRDTHVSATWQRVHSKAADLINEIQAGAKRSETLTVGDMLFLASVRREVSDAGHELIIAVLIPEGSVFTPTTRFLQAAFGMSPREAEVALLLAKRQSSKEIARHLKTKISTAERHTERVFAKLAVHNRREVEPVITRKLLGTFT